MSSCLAGGLTSKRIYNIIFVGEDEYIGANHFCRGTDHLGKRQLTHEISDRTKVRRYGVLYCRTAQS